MKAILIGCLCVMLLLTMTACGDTASETEKAADVTTTAATTTAATVTDMPISVVTGEAANGETAPSALTSEIIDETTTRRTTTSATTTTAAETTRPVVTEASTTVKTTAPTAAQAASLIIRDASSSDIAAVSDSRKYDLAESVYSYAVYLEADGRVQSVDILALELSFEDGMYTIVDTRRSLGAMRDGEKAIVWLDFPGDFSAWGISCTSASGDVREYMLTISGEDGSLVVIDGIM